MQNPQHLLRVTLQSIRDAIVTTDESACVQLLNPAAEELTGWSSAEAVGKPVAAVVELRKKQPNETEGARLDPAGDALRDGISLEMEGVAFLVAKGGRRTAVQVTAAPFRDSEGRIDGCVLVLHDVREALQLAERIAHLAHHDPLTGLPNRILFVDRLEQGTKFSDRNSDQVAVISVDLDHIERIKDAHGTGGAEALLKEAAFRMLAVLRESDTVCRLGAGEFVLMVPGVKSLADVEAVAAKLLEEIARPHKLDDATLETTCSIGISVYPRDATDAGTLMRMADGAMQRARSEGRNRFLFA